MEINTLDDFDIHHNSFDFATSSFESPDVQRKANLGPTLNQNMSQFMAAKASLQGRSVIHLFKQGSRERDPGKAVASTSNVISCPISLNQLLTPDYLNQQNLQIPFTLPSDLANLPPFFELPEGLGLEIFNLLSKSSELVLPALALDPRFLYYYQKQQLTAVHPVASDWEGAFPHSIATVQEKDYSSALAQVLAEISTLEQARAEAEVSAQMKVEIAERERLKALDAAEKVQEASIPPRMPQQGHAREPWKVTYGRWLANKTNATTSAAEQYKIAYEAIEEAKIAGGILLAQNQALAAAQVRASLVLLPLVQEVPQQTQQPGFYPQFDLELLCGKEYVSNLYQQFGLPDPFVEVTIDTTGSNPGKENLFLSRLMEVANIQDARNPISSNSPFVDPSYPKFTHKFEEPKITQPLNNEEALALLSIESYFKDRSARASIELVDNYASTLASAKPAGPFRAVPLLGYTDQSTIHFHCGISNNFSSVVEGGLCLNTSLDGGFAIQPHLIHSNNIAKGVLFVFFENVKTDLQILQSAGVSANLSMIARLPEFTLEHSKIQQSIEYEVEHLTTIAQSIIAKGNPNLKQVHVAFSNGGYVIKESLKILPPEYRDTIIVITAGTTAIIENGLAHKVYNVIGDKDWPSQVCNGGMEKIEAAKKKGAEIRIIPQNETQTGIGGHYFMQPEYQDGISEYINKKVMGTYEIY